MERVQSTPAAAENQPAWGTAGGAGARGAHAALLGALLAGSALAIGCARARVPPGGAASVLLVTVDTLRADRLGCYGNPRPVTPSLDRLSRQGVLFQVAIAPSCFTAPSMASISTARYPLHHGVLRWGDRGAGRGGRTAAETFRRLGYRTAFVSGHGALAGIEALARGFGRVTDRGDLDAEALTRTALDWLDRGGKGPFFLWVHYFEPHGPYEPPEVPGARWFEGGGDREGLRGVAFPSWGVRAARGGGMRFEERAEILTRLYDGEVGVVDRAVGRLLEGLRTRGMEEQTLVALTADHGENLADHAPFFDHRSYLYDSLVRVPLLVRLPGRPHGKRDPDPVPVLALVPTLLDLLGVEQGSGFDEGSFLREGEPGGSARRAIFLDSGLQEAPHKGVRAGRWKLSLDLGDHRARLYDLETDPGETHPRPASSNPRQARRLQGLLDTWLRGLPAPPPPAGRTGRPPLSARERARLTELGYF